MHNQSEVYKIQLQYCDEYVMNSGSRFHQKIHSFANDFKQMVLAICY